MKKRNFQKGLAWLLTLTLVFGEFSPALTVRAAEPEAEEEMLSEGSDGSDTEEADPGDTGAASDEDAEVSAEDEEGAVNAEDTEEDFEELPGETGDADEEEAAETEETEAEEESAEAAEAEEAEEAYEEEAEEEVEPEEELSAEESLSDNTVSEDAADLPEEDAESDSEPVQASNTSKVKIKLKYENGSAEALMVSVNQIRLAKSKGLLSYDRGIEKLALERACEIALRMDDTRPNGDSWDSILPYNVKQGSYKEFILQGKKDPGDIASGWSGYGICTDQVYSKIGVGHVVFNGHHYWCAIVTNVTIDDAGSARKSGEESKEIEIKNDYIKDIAVTSDPEANSKNKTHTIKLDQDVAHDLPKLSAKVKIDKHSPSDEAVPLAEGITASWEVDGGSTYATIDVKKGKITALAERGDSVLRAKVKAGSKEKKLEWNTHIVVYISKITVSTNSYKLQLDEKVELKLTVEPADADDLNVVMETSKKTVAKVDLQQKIVDKKIVEQWGVIDAVGVGDAVITVKPKVEPKVKKTNVSATCNVNVWMELSVEAPVILPHAYEIGKTDLIYMRSLTPEATILYTINGASPRENASGNSAVKIYKGPFTITEADIASDGMCTIKSVAYKDFETETKQGKKTERVYSYEVGEYYTLKKPEWGDVAEYPEDMEQWGNVSANIPSGLWVAEASVGSYVYNGKAQKPEGLRVYEGNRLLKEKTDYTISYKNNINAGPQAAVIIKMKKNYEQQTFCFTIEPADISRALSKSVTVAANGSLVPKANLSFNKKKLKEGNDYVIGPVSIKGPGNYVLTVKGVGNFTGTIDCDFAVLAAKLDLSKAKVSAVPAQTWTAGGVSVDSLKDKNGAKLNLQVTAGGTLLTPGTDYEASVIGGDTTGTATLRIKALEDGRASGVKDVNFKINGKELNKNNFSFTFEKNQTSFDYCGRGIMPETHVVPLYGGEELKRGRDYTVSYRKNLNPGTAEAVITAKDKTGYSGSFTMKYKICKVDLSKKNLPFDEKGNDFLLYDTEVQYEKGGAVPYVWLKVNGIELTEGVDYTIKCSNNKKVTAGGKKPSFTITGKGGYSGKVTRQFSVTAMNIAVLDSYSYAPDKTYSSKPGAYKTKPVIIDVNGKKLKAGTDYDSKEIYFRYSQDVQVINSGRPVSRTAGDNIDPKDVIPAGTMLHVRISGKGCYTGMMRLNYRIVQADISKAKVTVPDKTYTGEAIYIDNKEVTINNNQDPNVDFEILGYYNNVNAGKATVVIHGKGNYGGVKTVTFNIKKKGSGIIK